MTGVSWVIHNGKKILFVNYAGLNTTKPEELKRLHEILTEAKTLVTESPESILFLSDVTNAIATSDAMKYMKDFATFTTNSGKVGKECIIGVTGIKRALVNSVNLLTHTHLKTCDTIAQAKEYLTQ